MARKRNPERRREYEKSITKTRVNESMHRFESQIGNNASLKFIGCDYAYMKTKALAAWLVDHGVPCVAPEWERRATLWAYELYIETVEAVEDYCELLGVECEACLPDHIRQYEGLKVSAETGDGRVRVFWVTRLGRFIKYYAETARHDSLKGKRLKHELYIEYKVIGRHME